MTPARSSAFTLELRHAVTALICRALGFRAATRGFESHVTHAADLETIFDGPQIRVGAGGMAAFLAPVSNARLSKCRRAQKAHQTSVARHTNILGESYFAPSAPREPRAFAQMERQLVRQSVEAVGVFGSSAITFRSPRVARDVVLAFPGVGDVYRRSVQFGRTRPLVPRYVSNTSSRRGRRSMKVVHAH